MIRATGGTWLSYATTVLFQVLFALRFGTDHPASAYVIVFAVIAGVSGVLVSTAQSVGASRLLGEGGSLQTGLLKLMAGVVGGAGLISLALTLAADPLGRLLTRVSDYPPSLSSEL